MNRKKFESLSCPIASTSTPLPTLETTTSAATVMNAAFAEACTMLAATAMLIVASTAPGMPLGDGSAPRNRLVSATIRVSTAVPASIRLPPRTANAASGPWKMIAPSA